MVEEAITLENSDQLIDIDENFKLTAGPGSGKTRFLINHIKNVISNSNKLKNGRKIACITHTNIAVENIKKRLKTSPVEIEVSTIHSFLYKHVFKPYIWTISNEFGLNIDSIKSIREVFPSHGILPTAQRWMVKDIKEEFLFDSLRKLKWVYNDEKLRVETFGFENLPYSYLKEYKNNCWKKGLISPDDILFFSYNILTKIPKILTILQIKFPYLFLDEFQDTSALQSEIIKLMANAKMTIGVIGDKAQSIYEFQDANIESFINFNIKSSLKKYFIKNNYRSNIAIVEILNHINSTEFEQICSKNTNDSIIKPTIIIGNHINAYNKIVELLSSDNFYSMTYKNRYINTIKFELDYGNKSNFINNINTIFSKDTNYYRRLILRYTILAIESFRYKNIREAKSFMKFAYKDYDFDDLNALNNLFRLNSEYDNYKDLTITEFYNNFIYNHYTVKFKITNPKVKEDYDRYTYTDFALNLNKKMFDSRFRTIHSCKGEEFKNVSLFLETENELEFLKNPNIHLESHRRYYVALSRAKENLTIVVPTLDSNDYEIFQDLGFDIVKV